MGEGWRIFRRLLSHPRAYDARWLLARWLLEMSRLPPRSDREAAAYYRRRR